MKKKLKFRLQKTALKEEISPKNDNKYQQKTQQQPQQQHTVVKTSLIDRPYLETVHEEDLSLTNELQDDNSDCTDATSSLTSTIEIGVTVDYSTNSSTSSLTNQLDTNKTIKNDDLKSDSSSIDANDAQKPTESHLYEQLSQMKPLKPLNFKSSTSICLNLKEPETLQTLQTSSMIITPSLGYDELTDKAQSPIEQSDSKMTSSSTSSISSSSSSNLSGTNHENIDSAQQEEITPGTTNKNIKNDVSSNSSTCSFGSSGYNSDNFNGKNQKNDDLKSDQTAVSTMVVVPRRNSSIYSNGSQSQAGSTASRRVSLSVTDL